MKIATKQEIYKLESEVKMLRKLKEMQKILLNTGAYSNTNIEKQMKQLENVKTPEWEKQIVLNMWDTQTKLSHILLKKIDKLVKKINKEIESGE